MTGVPEPPAPDPDVDWTLGTPRVVVRRCAGCGHQWYLRRTFCPSCGGADIGGTPASGGGTVVAVTVVRRRPGSSEPVGIALVDLVEGVRVMGRCPLDASVGQRVTLGFVEDEVEGAQSPIPWFD